jgi:hypothetical protein
MNSGRDFISQHNAMDFGLKKPVGWHKKRKYNESENWWRQACKKLAQIEKRDDNN